MMRQRHVMTAVVLSILLALTSLRYDLSMSSSSRPKYRAILLILSSAESPFRLFQRQIYRAYMEREPSIKVLFVYACGGFMAEECVDPAHDLYFPYIRESPTVPKVVRAFRHIEEHYDYDYIVRTNIGTFWVLPRLLEELNSGLPTQKFFSGSGPLPPDSESMKKFFVSAVGCIISRDLVRAMVRHPERVDYWTVEDRAMGHFFHYVMGAPLNVTNRIHFLEHIVSFDEDIFRREAEEADEKRRTHFRVKSAMNREEMDTWLLMQLLRRYYNASPREDASSLCLRRQVSASCRGW